MHYKNETLLAIIAEQGFRTGKHTSVKDILEWNRKDKRLFGTGKVCDMGVERDFL